MGKRYERANGDDVDAHIGEEAQERGAGIECLQYSILGYPWWTLADIHVYRGRQSDGGGGYE